MYDNGRCSERCLLMIITNSMIIYPYFYFLKPTSHPLFYAFILLQFPVSYTTYDTVLCIIFKQNTCMNLLLSPSCFFSLEYRPLYYA
jgi:hypothetical protein